jgi:hypothetical protein
VSGLTTRPTEDLDFFGEPGRSDVAAVLDQLEHAAIERGWTVERVQVSDSFARLHLHGDGDVLVDIALDLAGGSSSHCSIGPSA